MSHPQIQPARAQHKDKVRPPWQILDMGRFREQLRTNLPPTFILPEAIGLLYDWIEAHGLIIETPQQQTVGLLQPDPKPGTTIQLHTGDAWPLPTSSTEYQARLWVFARTGADGSSAALWVDDHEQQHVVHLGSGSGSTMACVLATDPVDFLRLLAIGYDEICWPEDIAVRPDETESGSLINPTFRRWVEDTFSVEIPDRGTNIVRHLAEYWDEDSPDTFCQWLQKIEQESPPPPSPYEAERTERIVRRAERLPKMRAASVALLAAYPGYKDGQQIAGTCPSCGAQGPLRINGDGFALCWSCHWKW